MKFSDAWSRIMSSSCDVCWGSWKSCSTVEMFAQTNQENNRYFNTGMEHWMAIVVHYQGEDEWRTRLMSCLYATDLPMSCLYVCVLQFLEFVPVHTVPWTSEECHLWWSGFIFHKYLLLFFPNHCRQAAIYSHFPGSSGMASWFQHAHLAIPATSSRSGREFRARYLVKDGRHVRSSMSGRSRSVRIDANCSPKRTPEVTFHLWITRAWTSWGKSTVMRWVWLQRCLPCL